MYLTKRTATKRLELLWENPIRENLYPWSRTAVLAVDVGPLYGGNPWSHLFEDLSSWFPHGDDHGGGYPPFYAAPQASGDGPVNVPSYEEVPPGSNEPLDWG